MHISLAMEGGWLNIVKKGQKFRKFYPAITAPRGWRWRCDPTDPYTVIAIDLNTGRATYITEQGGFGRQRAALKKARQRMIIATQRFTSICGAEIVDERNSCNGVTLVKNGRVVRRLGNNVDLASVQNTL